MLVPLVVRDVPDGDLSDASSPYGYPGPVSNAGTDDEFWCRALESLVETLRSEGIVTVFVRTHPRARADRLDGSAPVGIAAPSRHAR